MALFSQRRGIRPISKEVQRESIDAELRNMLWSALKIVIWDQWREPDRMTGYASQETKEVHKTVQLIWLHYLKHPLDTVPEFHSGYPKSAYDILRDYFFDAKWWEIYDFMEFCAANIPEHWAESLCSVANGFFESENSAYRFVGLQIVEVTDDQELAEIEDALATPISEAKQHIQRSISFLFDRKNPDYRNSVKESISGVEAVCTRLAQKDRATLGDALSELKKYVPLHPAFEAGLKKIYGYTSDSGGIRHALSENDICPTFADAKFMLVSCSAFINYLATKSAEANIDF